MWAQFGTITFNGVFGLSGMVTSHEAEFAELPLIGDKPRLQFVGRKLDTLQARIYLHASFVDPMAIVAELDQMRDTATVAPLVTGVGEIVGTFVIKSVKRNYEMTDPNGLVLSMAVDLDLVEVFTPGSTAEAQSGIINTGFGLTGAGAPTVRAPGVQLASMESIAAANLTSGLAANNSVIAAVSRAAVNPATARADCFNVSKLAGVANNALVSLRDTVNRDPQSALYARTRDLADYLPTAEAHSLLMASTAINVVAAADAGSNAGLATGLQSLSNQATQLAGMNAEVRRLSAGLVALFASRR